MRAKTVLLRAGLAAVLLFAAVDLLVAILACGAAAPPQPEAPPETIQPVAPTQVVSEPTELVAPTPGGAPPATHMAPPPPPTSAPVVSLAQIVQDELARLSPGRIAYNPPAVMRVGQRERVEVRITQRVTQTLTEGLQGTGEAKVESLPVSTFMKVRLTGQDFEITELSSEEQIVAAEGFTQWAWDVVPLRSGRRPLSIVVTARVKVPGYADEQKDLGVFEREVQVRVNGLYSLKAFLLGNQGILLATVLIPILAAAGRWAWKRYQGRCSTSPPK